jgi:hypothetical protein
MIASWFKAPVLAGDPNCLFVEIFSPEEDAEKAKNKKNNKDDLKKIQGNLFFIFLPFIYEKDYHIFAANTRRKNVTFYVRNALT